MPKPAKTGTTIIPGGCGCLLLVGLLAALASLLSLTLWLVPLETLGADDESVEDPARIIELANQYAAVGCEELLAAGGVDDASVLRVHRTAGNGLQFANQLLSIHLPPPPSYGPLSDATGFTATQPTNLCAGSTPS